MIELRARLFVSLLVLLAAAPEARPQTGSSSPPGVVRKTGKTGNSRSSPAQNSMAASSPVLCFQPGVGWQRIPTGQPNGSATGDASGPPAAANPPAVDARLLSAKQAQSAACAGILPDKQELGAGVGTLTILNPNRAIRSAASAKPGAVPSFQVNSLLHPNGSAGLNSVRMTPGAMPSASTHFASEAEPDDYADQLGGRAFHAYISPIKLRRLIRNAPDYRTRKKLQQLNPATKLHHAKVDTNTGQLAGMLLQGEPVRATSLGRSDASGRTRGKPRD
jgi:hypothetical protein